MSAEKSPKVKEISLAEARSLARAALAFIGSKDASTGDTVRLFGELTAANRRAVMDAMKIEIKGIKPSVDGDRLMQLASLGLNPGRVTKQDFVAGLVLAVLELAASVDAGSRSIPKELLQLLILNAPGRDLPDFDSLDLSRLARSRVVSAALASFLEDSDDETLRSHVQRWGNLLGHIVAIQGPAIGLSAGTAERLLRLMANPVLVLPPQLVLATHWLVELAGHIPVELTRRQPFALLLVADTSRVPEHHRPAPEAPPPVSPAQPKGAKREELFALIDATLADVERQAEGRMQVLKEELAKRTADLSGVREALAREEENNRARASRIDAIEKEIRLQRERTEQLERDSNALRVEVEKWKKEVEVLHGSRERQVEDARSEVRKELLRSARTHLVNLRGFLLDLQVADCPAPARMAATSYDEFVRVLQKQQYVTPEELPRLGDRVTKAPQ